eukprot:GILK01005489.1.p1 GENE.GILK01005489.1~~GILK01005489.1.p1  ORF type:complete len:382 (+),score=38.91 GILK01005489.1:39-1148(+)
MAPKHTRYLDFPCFALNWGEHGRVMISGGGGGAQYGIVNCLSVFQVNNLEKPTTLTAVLKENTQDNIVTNITYSRERRLYACSLGGNCRLFFLNKEGEAKELVQFQTDFAAEPYQKAVRFSSSGDLLATAGEDGTLRLWQLSAEHVEGQDHSVPIAAPKLLHSCTGHTKAVNDIDFSPDGSLVCTSSFDLSCLIFAVASGLCIKRLTFAVANGPNLIFRGCRFSKDGQYLFTVQTPPRGSAYITQWTVGTDFAALKTVVAHLKPISAFTISEDSIYLGVGTNDGAVKIFCANSLACLNERKPHEMPVTNVSFGMEKRPVALLSGSADYTYHFLPIAKGFSLITLLVLLLLIALAVLMTLKFHFKMDVGF